TRAGGALAIHPGGRQLGRDEPEVDAGSVGTAVPDRAYDLAGEIVALRGACRLCRIVAGIVDAVRPRIARVTDLVDLVVARLRARGIDDARAAIDLVDTRAEAADEVHEEGRDDEGRLVAAPLRGPRNAARGVPRQRASRDAGARPVWIAARHTRDMLASRRRSRRLHRERRLDTGRERQ